MLLCSIPAPLKPSAWCIWLLQPIIWCPSIYFATKLLWQVRFADFCVHLSRLSTPSELMIMMTEMFARIEAKPNDQLKAEDMEFAVSKALEQAV